MICSKRMKPLMEESIFSQLYAIKKDLLNKGKDIIDLSIGSPDLPPMPHIVETLLKESQKAENFRYAISDLPELRKAAATWYKRRFNVTLNPTTQITSLMGSQEGLAHLCLALTDCSDLVMVHNPGYPVYHAGPMISGNELYGMPCRKGNFLIDFEKIPENISKKAKLMVLGYPNNPTTQLAPKSFYEELVAYAKKYNIMVVHDNAYCELVFNNKKTGSFLEVDGAIDVGIELNSLSKTYNLAGIRVGFALGNAEMIKNLATLKSHLDYGIFIPIQKAAIEALTGSQKSIKYTKSAYEMRRNVLCEGLNSLGWNVNKPEATMFVWAKLPEGFNDSFQFTKELAEKSGVIVTPGVAFGEKGEGNVRIALVQSIEQMGKAVEYIKKSGIIM